MRKVGTRTRQEDPEHFPEIRQVTHAGVRYRLNHQMAVGAFSTVFQAVDEWGNPLAVKRYHADGDLSLWKNEVDNLLRFRHPNVTYLHAAFEQEGWRYLVLERWGVAIGRLRVNDASKRERLCRFSSRGVLEALHFIHRAGYVHGDMNPGNILIKLSADKSPMGIKLCDLALGRPVPSTGEKGTIATWNPGPEWIDSAAFGTVGQPMDVYHAALALLNVLLGELPVFGNEEILGGAPQRLAMDLGTPLGAALAQALAPKSTERPVAIDLWRAIARTGAPKRSPAT